MFFIVIMFLSKPWFGRECEKQGGTYWIKKGEKRVCLFERPRFCSSYLQVALMTYINIVIYVYLQLFEIQ